MRTELILCLFEFREFDVYEGQFIIEYFSALIFELNVMNKLFFRFMVIKNKIENPYGVNGF